MAPEDHYRRLVSALNEASTFEDPQRLYPLGLPSHGVCPYMIPAPKCAPQSPPIRDPGYLAAMGTMGVSLGATLPQVHQAHT